MKTRELAALLRLLDKHPRVTSCTVDGVSLQLTEAPFVLPEGAAEEDTPGLELPDGVPDPRQAIRALYKKLGMREGGKAPS